MSQTIFEVPISCRGIAAVLLKEIDGQYHVLLVKRASNILDGAWCYIGGGIEQGEKAWEAARREIEEETGINDVSLYSSNKFDQFYSPHEEYIYMAPVFVGYVGSWQHVRLNHEHSEYKWLPVEEAIETVTLPGNDEVLAFIDKHFVQRTPSPFLRVGKA
ncbi:NUDIX domain-containing protein [Sediminibacillus halophilus]|uniref:dATP pyrophosphohydrolase n=1 Tax=Sediminibacillus halophilus TaxID=482461 RepID=A0A1G9RW47_9BACI|nr:NUDIX domain-containing protein [Sediminibacillus halophilus]SDM27384.1 dATP pyrophosphohydrolase [Sediminibacillus halophilus]